MTNAELDGAFAKLSDAIRRDDDKSAGEAALVLAKSIITSLARIAEAIEQIARNVPTK